MTKDNIKPEYFKKSMDLKELVNVSFDEAERNYNEFSSSFMFNYFNCDGFKGGGYCGTPNLKFDNKLSEFYEPFIYRGRPEIRLEVLNKYRLCVHTIYINNYFRNFNNVKIANKLKVYKFSRGRNKNGYNIYIKDPKTNKRVYAGAILYKDDLLANNVIYAIRELYYIGLTVNSIASIIKYLTKYRGLDNLGLEIDLTY